MKKNYFIKKTTVNTVHISERDSVVRQLRLPAAGRDSRFAVPCPSDRNALRNPQRQHVPTRQHQT